MVEGGRIRTCVAFRQRFYRPPVLTAHPPLRNDVLLFMAPDGFVCWRFFDTGWSPRGESNPLTCRLQIGCAAIAPLGQKDAGCFLPDGFTGSSARTHDARYTMSWTQKYLLRRSAEGTIKNSLKSRSQYRKLVRIKSRLSWNLFRGLDSQATVYYDGACGLCRGAVKWMAKADWFQRVKWTPGQELSSFPRGLTPADLDEAMYLEDSQCRLHGGFFRREAVGTNIASAASSGPIYVVAGCTVPGSATVRVYRPEPGLPSGNGKRRREASSVTIR